MPLVSIIVDGIVSSLPVPGNYRLGEERGNVSEGVQQGEGIFFDLYRERKLWEKLFEAVAVRNDLTVTDVKLLYCLSQSHKDCTEKEIADVLNISKRALVASVQKLLVLEMISPPEKQRRKRSGCEKQEQC